MHKAVILDLGKVLIHFDFNRGYRALEGLCPYSAAEIPKRIGPSGLPQRFESGLIEPRAFFSEMRGLLDLSLDYDRFCEIWNIIFAEPLIPERIVEGLAARYRLVLLSNTNPIHFEMLRRTYPFLRHFHHMVLSYEVGSMKPQPAIYRAAIECSGCLPSECFYTDDIAAYVEAGREMGLDATLFLGLEKFEKDLAERGIAWAGPSGPR